MRALNRKRIALFTISATLFCLLSIMVPQAHVSDKADLNTRSDIKVLLNEVSPEANLEVMNWMLYLPDGNSAISPPPADCADGS